ncbi:pentapeptide repeat-containing protein [Endozoicomonas arenosclerae]|uniref:pentapeptide repeat-containing protein n=1 Tax=Endozoicomonas arenosclerae TaxID=1633495 RepID=UPI0007855395|nr:pentapeptide repeat-containing protein [Endozoicomonas arenosclerae]
MSDSGKDTRQKAKEGLGRFDVLAKGGLKTEGLSGKSAIQLKGLGDYKIVIEPAQEAQMVMNNPSSTDLAAELQALLHPGMNVPARQVLKGMELDGRDLERVCFNQTDLRGCNFRKTQLRGARFKGCDLSGADFTGADLKDTIFEDSVLEGADLRHCRLDDARLVDCNLFAVNFDQSCLDNAVIDSCNMGAQSFHNSSCMGLKMHNSQIIHGFLDDANFTGSELRNMEFRNCTLTSTHFNNALMEECHFKGCDSLQEGPVFSGGTLNKVVMTDCEFKVPKLVQTRISNSYFTRVDLDSALMEGTQFNEVIFEQGEFRECYSLEESPSFNHCRLDHITIDQAEFSHARFDRSSFIGAMIRDSDFGAWTMNHTGLDGETSIE